MNWRGFFASKAIEILSLVAASSIYSFNSDYHWLWIIFASMFAMLILYTVTLYILYAPIVAYIVYRKKSWGVLKKRLIFSMISISHPLLCWLLVVCLVPGDGPDVYSSTLYVVVMLSACFLSSKRIFVEA